MLPLMRHSCTNSTSNSIYTILEPEAKCIMVRLVPIQGKTLHVLYSVRIPCMQAQFENQLPSPPASPVHGGGGGSGGGGGGLLTAERGATTILVEWAQLAFSSPYSVPRSESRQRPPIW